jgi:hypothetical protein
VLLDGEIQDMLHNKTVVPRATDEPLRTNWLDAARGVERLVDSDMNVQDGVREHPFVVAG